jgi:hypothetical protein
MWRKIREANERANRHDGPTGNAVRGVIEGASNFD